MVSLIVFAAYTLIVTGGMGFVLHVRLARFGKEVRCYFSVLFVVRDLVALFGFLFCCHRLAEPVFNRCLQGFGIRQEFRLQGYVFLAHILAAAAVFATAPQSAVRLTVFALLQCFLAFCFGRSSNPHFLLQWVDALLVVLCSFTALLAAIPTGYPLFLSYRQERLERQAQV